MTHIFKDAQGKDPVASVMPKTLVQILSENENLVKINVLSGRPMSINGFQPIYQGWIQKTDLQISGAVSSQP